MILEDCIEKNPNRKTRYDLIAFVIQMEEISEVRPNKPDEIERKLIEEIIYSA